MAAAVYASDLTDIFTDGTTTGWSALGGGSSGLNQETDYFVQGTSCLSKNAFAGSTKGMIYDSGSLKFLSSSQDAFFLWVTHQTANSLDTIVNGGLQVLVGSATGDYNKYYIAGSDTVVYDDRWLCIPVDPASATASATTGTPSATDWRHFGVMAKMVGGPTKGAPLAIDAIRVGGEYAYTLGDVTFGYATFAGAATFNDAVTRRYGFIQLSGKTFKIQGTHRFGTGVSAVDFRDSNRSIVIADTTMTDSDFNQFVVQNSLSNIEWTSIQISALGTNARGNFECISSATLTFEGCTFTDMGTFVFDGTTNANTMTSCTWRRCGPITTDSATLNSCLITASTATTGVGAVTGAVITDDLADIDQCTFVRGSVGHAVELTSVVASPMDWDNTTSGYAAGSAGTGTTAVGNEDIYINVGSGALTINVANGATIPSVRTAGATVNVVVAPAPIVITVTDDAGTAIQNARVEVSATETSGTVTSGDVLLTGLTNVSGVIEDTAFAYESAWNPSGLDVKVKARQGSVAPYKVPGQSTGTITPLGLSLTIALLSDE